MQQCNTISEARWFFRQFVESWDGSPHAPRSQGGNINESEMGYLQEYLAYWIEVGDGIPATGRNFETYMRVVVDIADAVVRGEISCDYKGTEEAGYQDAYQRNVVGIHDEGYAGSRAFEKEHYEVVAYRREHLPDPLHPPYAPMPE
jgi:hypothetical protein